MQDKAQRIPMASSLPISEILGDIEKTLQTHNRAIIHAPPGVGKTTLIPLHLLEHRWLKPKSKILLLEPRRLAARAAAKRIADLLGEKVGAHVGYQMRFEQAISAQTRILVVTQGVLTRMLIEDPQLPNIDAILFDEFHERHLEGDFALALSLEIQEALRDDLRIVVMSATLPQQTLIKCLGDMPILTSKGQSFHNEIRYQALAPHIALEEGMAQTILKTLSSEKGSILAFLPGQKEIKKVAQKLAHYLPDDVDVFPLYGNLDLKQQQEAIAPPLPLRRKVVLSTSLAESSLTIEGISIVIDSGLARSCVFEPETGLTRLITEKASLASITQRAGRAGRTQNGLVIRLWNEEENVGLPAFPKAEILNQDLSKMLLDCASFGIHKIEDLKLLDYPPAVLVQAGQSLLKNLNAVNETGHITAFGKQLTRLPLHPCLGAMVLTAKRYSQSDEAALLVLLLSDAGLTPPFFSLQERLRWLKTNSSYKAKQARHFAAKIAGAHPKQEVSAEPISCAGLYAQSFPLRLAQKKGENGQFLLAKGGAVFVPPEEGLSHHPFLLITDMAGTRTQRRALCAEPITEKEVEGLLAAHISQHETYFFDKESKSVKAKATRQIGAVTLSSTSLQKDLKEERVKETLLEIFYKYGPSLFLSSAKTKSFLARAQWLHKTFSEPWPDMSEASLKESAPLWLLPFLPPSGRLDDLAQETMLYGLQTRIPLELHKEMDRLAPAFYQTPQGKNLPICYEEETPLLRAKCQDLFGVPVHPFIGGGREPLRIALLSPALRPIQITTNLPEFWKGSWRDVRKELRGRYPKHAWPEEPALFKPTSAKGLKK